jgi:hypothetical protein
LKGNDIFRIHAVQRKGHGLFGIEGSDLNRFLGHVFGSQYFDTCAGTGRFHLEDQERLPQGQFIAIPQPVLGDHPPVDLDGVLPPQVPQLETAVFEGNDFGMVPGNKRIGEREVILGFPSDPENLLVDLEAFDFEFFELED